MHVLLTPKPWLDNNVCTHERMYVLYPVYVYTQSRMYACMNRISTPIAHQTDFVRFSLVLLPVTVCLCECLCLYVHHNYCCIVKADRFILTLTIDKC